MKRESQIRMETELDDIVVAIQGGKVSLSIGPDMLMGSEWFDTRQALMDPEQWDHVVAMVDLLRQQADGGVVS